MNARRILLIAAIPALALGWYLLSPGSKAVIKGAAPANTAVMVEKASTRDVPLWLSGLGTVQAFNTVTVRPRASGSLDKVNFVEGQTVKAGDVLAEIDPRPYRSTLEQAKARQTQDEAALVNARQELERGRSLVEKRAETQRVVEQMETAVTRAEALVAADKAAVDAAQLDLDFTTIRAPISGRTGVRLVDAGNVVTASQSTGLLVITQVKPISVVFTIPQRYFPALRASMKGGAIPPVQALNDHGEVLAEGKLDLLDNQIDATTGTLRLKASFPNDDLTLWPGQLVSARVLVETRKQATGIATSAVQAGLNGPFVYVVRANDTVEARTIKEGPAVDGYTVVEEGLKAGERVVTDGQNKLKPDASVAVLPAKP